VKFSHLFLIPIVLLLSGCDNPFAVTPGTQGKNIVTGIYVTSEWGELYSVWGNPKTSRTGTSKEKNIFSSDEEEVGAPVSFELNVPYPNPFIGSSTVQFRLPVASSVTLWYETAYLSQTENVLPNQSRVERRFRRVFLVKDSKKAAGTHSVQLGTLLNNDNELDDNGERIAPGFYRVFIQAGSFTAFHDIYIGGIGYKPPIGLEEYLYY